MKNLLLLILLFIPAILFSQTILATYEIHDHASGLAYDGDYIWYGRYGTEGEKIYKFDPVIGIILDSLNLGTANLDDAYGLTWDGQYLWVTNHVGSDFTLKFDTNGNIISQFPNPSDYMSGLAWNGSELYMGDYYNPDGAIYRCNTGGTILESFTAPDNQPWDLAWDGINLWMCDYYSHTIYQIDPVTHNVLYSFPSPMNNPAGLVWDGQYLWVCDEGEGYSIDHLYKIDPFGGGTPEIQLSAGELNFSYVSIGTNPFQTMIIYNNGDADLEITDLTIDQFNAGFSVDPGVTVPFTIPQGTNTSIDIFFAPLNFGQVYGTLHVMSNDPINPDVEVELSGFGIYPQQTAVVSTEAIEFGGVWIPYDGLTGRDFAIYNHGAPPLNLISLEIDNPVFYHDGFNPGSLGSMDTLDLIVYFEPTAPVNYQGIMTLTTDDPINPIIMVGLYGSGQENTFELGDIIWQYQAEGPSYGRGYNSIKYMTDVNGDGINEVIAANENYLTYSMNGQAAGYGDEFWNFDTGWDPMRTGDVEYERGMVSAPDLDDDGTDDVVIGTGGGSRSVFAISGIDGHEIWNFDSHNYGGEGGWVYEVTCEDDWNSDGVFDVLAAVGGPSGSSDPKSVFLLDGTNGNVIWRAHIGETVYSVRALEDMNSDGFREVICASADYEAHLINGANGNTVWSHDIGYAAFSVNRIEDLDGDGFDDAVFAAGFSGVYALSAVDGDEIWTFSPGGSLYYLEVTGDLNGSGYDDVLQTTVSGAFYALEGSDGSVIWTYPVGTNVLSLSAVPDVDGDLIPDACCGAMNSIFYAISGADGSLLFSYNHGGGTSGAFDAVGWVPDIDNSGAPEFLAGTRDGHLYCFSGGVNTTVIPSIDLTLTPIGYPIEIPPGGGSFIFQIDVYNYGSEPAFFDFWTMAELPNGNLYGPTFYRPDNGVAAGFTITRQLTQQVPGGAPAGDYTYYAYAGNYAAQIIYDEGSFDFSKTGDTGGDFSIDGWNLTGWDLEDDINDNTPVEFALHDAYPNPFNPTTIINYQLSENSHVRLAVYDIAGREVALLVDGYENAGGGEVLFIAKGLTSGVYFVRLEAGDFMKTQKIVLMK